MSVWVTAWLLTSGAWAGNRLEGQVVDRNGEPVDRAIISLVPGNVQLMTDREGRFLIDYLRDDKGERTRLKGRTSYVLEVFKPGFHAQALDVAYRNGPLALPMVTLVEETLSVEIGDENLDPALFGDPSHAGGAAYEGQ